MDKRSWHRYYKQLLDEIESSRQRTEHLKDTLALFLCKKYHFSIYLNTMWADNGEQNVTYNAATGDTLNKAAKDADIEFMRVNKRTDVQARKSAAMVIDDSMLMIVDHPHNKKKRKKKVPSK